jgi:hypothetical protein
MSVLEQVQVQPANSIYIRAYPEETHIVFSVEATTITLVAVLLNKMNFR